MSRLLPVIGISALCGAIAAFAILSAVGAAMAEAEDAMRAEDDWR